MNPEEMRQTLEKFQLICADILEISKTASKNNKSLSGDNFYSKKFHQAIVEISKLELAMDSILALLPLDTADSANFRKAIDTLKSAQTKMSDKNEARRVISLICGAKLPTLIDSLTANPIPLTEQVLPLAVVNGTREYLKQLVVQMNGCYEHQWYDACSVMMRKFVEILIIESYEAKGKEQAIKDKNGDYLLLSDLVDRLIQDSSWNLGREPKRVLPKVKSLGDRSAHKRYYLSTKADVDNILSGFRVLADELLHLANYK